MHVSCLILMNYITLCLSDAGGKLEANWLSPYISWTEPSGGLREGRGAVEAQSELWPAQAIFRTHVS